MVEFYETLIGTEEFPYENLEVIFQNKNKNTNSLYLVN